MVDEDARRDRVVSRGCGRVRSDVDAQKAPRRPQASRPGRSVSRRRDAVDLTLCAATQFKKSDTALNESYRKLLAIWTTNTGRVLRRHNATGLRFVMPNASSKGRTRSAARCTACSSTTAAAG